MASKLLLYSFAVLVLAQVVISQAHPQLHNAPFEVLQPRDECKNIEGNSDFYGIGVRIGFYLLWISSLITFVFNPADSASIGDAQTIFDLANLIAIIVLTVKQSHAKNEGGKQVHVIVPILLFYMFVGGCVVSVTSAAASIQEWKTAHGMKKFSTSVRQIFVQLTFLSMLGYSIFFWATGFHNFELVPGCGVYIFPIPTRLGLDGNPVIAILAIPVLVSLYLLIWWISYKRLSTEGEEQKKLANSNGFERSSRTSFRNMAKSSSRIPERWRTVWASSKWTILSSGSIGLTILYCIVGIESNISRNKVQGVNDILNTGQLIPFIIGLFSLPTGIWEVIKLKPHILDRILPSRKSRASRENGTDNRPMIPRNVYKERPNSYSSLKHPDAIGDENGVELEEGSIRSQTTVPRDY